MKIKSVMGVAGLAVVLALPAVAQNGTGNSGQNRTRTGRQNNRDSSPLNRGGCSHMWYRRFPSTNTGLSMSREPTAPMSLHSSRARSPS